MNRSRFQEISGRYPDLRIAIVGDFCLDRYFEIDPALAEISIETGLPVHNVVRTRCQPGAAGTILNNVSVLGAGAIYPVGFCGDDGEGWELQRALPQRRGVRMDWFLRAPERATFTYSKPLICEPGKAPVELNRLDSKNWTPTPPAVSAQIGRAIKELAGELDAVILMDQVDRPETGVITRAVLETAAEVAARRPELLILADSRRGLAGYPRVALKMNRAELARMLGLSQEPPLDEVKDCCRRLAEDRGKPVFVSLAEEGIMGACPGGEAAHARALPVRGPIDIVGAGDAVTANLALALAAGASMCEALELAMAAASVVIHQLGTTGTASVEQLWSALEC